MPTITLKNVPAKLHARLKAQAKAHKRSLNQEAMVCIEMAIRSERLDPERFLAEARELRERIARAVCDGRIRSSCAWPSTRDANDRR